MSAASFRYNIQNAFRSFKYMGLRVDKQCGGTKVILSTLNIFRNSTGVPASQSFHFEILGNSNSSPLPGNRGCLTILFH